MQSVAVFFGDAESLIDSYRLFYHTGIEGGFNTEEDFEWRVDNKIVILPAFTELTVEDAAALFGENVCIILICLFSADMKTSMHSLIFPKKKRSYK